MLNNGQTVWTEQFTNQGGPKEEFLVENGLNVNSTPQDWLMAFVPLYNGTARCPDRENNVCFSHKWAKFTGMDSSAMHWEMKAIKWHKQFKAFFSLEDPTKPAPTRKEHPTYKVDSFQIPVLYGHFIFAINQHWRNGPRKATHHCIVIFGNVQPT